MDPEVRSINQYVRSLEASLPLLISFILLHVLPAMVSSLYPGHRRAIKKEILALIEKNIKDSQPQKMAGLKAIGCVNAVAPTLLYAAALIICTYYGRTWVLTAGYSTLAIEVLNMLITLAINVHVGMTVYGNALVESDDNESMTGRLAEKLAAWSIGRAAD